MILNKDTLKQYAATRPGTNSSIVCHAPFVSLNFEQNGNVRACCYNFKHVLGVWPRDKIKDIWNGLPLEELRKYVLGNNLGGGCKECGNMIVSGNYQGVRARYYDEFAEAQPVFRMRQLWKTISGLSPYPKVMEFELSNQCNLECVMCNGYFSSSIRKNREKLPPVSSVYDDRFVTELEEFIPHLTDAKFLGGEPFMIDIYLKIWEKIRQINPAIRIHITTNGTFLTDRVKNLLEGLNAGIILSIDSVNPETYRKIRINGNFDRVMESVEYFRSYAQRKKTFLSIAACPITHNWQELPELLDFCIQKNIALYFNAVFSPPQYSLREQSAEYLSDVIAFLDSHPLPVADAKTGSQRNVSLNTYTDFVNLLRGWLREKKELTVTSISNAPSLIDFVFSRQPINNWSVEEIEEKLAALATMNGKIYLDKETVLLNRIANLFLATPRGKLKEVIRCYFKMHSQIAGTDVNSSAKKIEFLASLIDNHPKREDILFHMAQAPPHKLAEDFYTMSGESLQQNLKRHFG